MFKKKVFFQKTKKNKKISKKGLTNQNFGGILI